MAEDNRPIYRDFLGSSGIDDEEPDDSLQKHNLPYPSANKSSVSPPSMIPSMSAAPSKSTLSV